MKYVLSHALPNKQDASVKAHTDIDRFLSSEGYDILTFETRSGNNKIFRQINRLLSIRRLAKLVTYKDTLLVQYPVYSSSLDTDKLYEQVIMKANKKIAIVHDLPFLRDAFPPIVEDQKKELKRLNIFDSVIVHNEAMRKKLLELGLKSNIIELGLFDYYTPDTIKPTIAANISGNIFFAGNLNKSTFVKQLKSINLIKYHLWGNIDDSKELDDSVAYHGSVPSDELPKLLVNGWGLVWDGDSINSVDGLGGQYLQYIDPHKTSLYISAGVPVIVWKNAGVAKYIEDHNLGITISSLDEIPKRVESLTLAQYHEILKSVEQVQKLLVDGKMIESAIAVAESES